jgi:CHAD domain-containing protein
LELFQQCWGRALATYARSAAQMQKALGDLHDCDLWIDSIGEQINDARKRKHEEHLEGLIWLLSHFVKLRTKHLRRAYDLWREWEADDLSDQLRQTFRSSASE